jgi:hypothetical protein
MRASAAALLLLLLPLCAALTRLPLEKRHARATVGSIRHSINITDYGDVCACRHAALCCRPCSRRWLSLWLFSRVQAQYYGTVSVGQPPQLLTAVFDTGADVATAFGTLHGCELAVAARAGSSDVWVPLPQAEKENKRHSTCVLCCYLRCVW